MKRKKSEYDDNLCQMLQPASAYTLIRRQTVDKGSVCWPSRRAANTHKASSSGRFAPRPDLPTPGNDQPIQHELPDSISKSNAVKSDMHKSLQAKKSMLNPYPILINPIIQPASYYNYFQIKFSNFFDINIAAYCAFRLLCSFFVF